MIIKKGGVIMKLWKRVCSGLMAFTLVLGGAFCFNVCGDS